MYSEKEIETMKTAITDLHNKYECTVTKAIMHQELVMRAKLNLLMYLVQNEKEELGIRSLNLAESYDIFTDKFCDVSSYSDIDDKFHIMDEHLNFLEQLGVLASLHFEYLFDGTTVTHMTDMEAVAVHMLNCKTAEEMFGDTLAPNSTSLYEKARKLLLNVIFEVTGSDLSNL